MNAPQKIPSSAEAEATRVLLWVDGRAETAPDPAAWILEPDKSLTVEEIKKSLDSAGAPSVLAIEIPVFSDGRAHTVAQRLRSDLGYEGELRAVGDVGVDHLHYLARVGFDSFLLRAGTDVDDARAALARFEAFYVGVQTAALPG